MGKLKFKHFFNYFSSVVNVEKQVRTRSSLLSTNKTTTSIHKETI